MSIPMSPAPLLLAALLALAAAPAWADPADEAVSTAGQGLSEVQTPAASPLPPTIAPVTPASDINLALLQAQAQRWQGGAALYADAGPVAQQPSLRAQAAQLIARMHGEVGATIGSNGLRAAYGWVDMPVNDNLDVQVDFLTARYGDRAKRQSVGGQITFGQGR